MLVGRSVIQLSQQLKERKFLLRSKSFLRRSRVKRSLRGRRQLDTLLDGVTRKEEPKIPELPEIETVRRQLSDAGLVGRKVSQAINMPGVSLRSEVPSLIGLRGACVKEVRRRAKYLGIIFDNGMTLLVHFGMSGMVNYVKKEHHASDVAQRHVIFKLILDEDKGQQKMIFMYSDPRKFGSVVLLPSDQVVQFFTDKKLGKEPLREDFTPQALTVMMSRYTGNMKQFLMDQTQVAGLGNIYANEVMFRVNVYPGTKACDCRAKGAQIHRAIVEILTEAIERGGSTIHSYSSVNGKPGEAQKAHHVYGREGLACVRTHKCKAKIVRSDDFDGRGTFWCPNCQPET